MRNSDFMSNISRFLGSAMLCVIIARSAGSAEINTASILFRLSSETGAYEVLDKGAGVTWRSQPARFGEVTLNISGKPQRFQLTRPTIRQTANSVTLEFRPLTNQPAVLRVNVKALRDSRTLEFSYAADAALKVESIRLLDESFWTTGDGYAVVPVR